MKRKSGLTLLRSTALVFTATVLHAGAATGTWNADALGNWTDATKWTGGIPNAVGDTANLTFNITAARTITMNGDQTIGTLNIGDPVTAGVAPAGFSAVTLSPGTSSTNARSKLTFDQTGVADAILTVPTVAGVAANSISAPYVQLNDNLAITTGFPDSATVQLAISGIISDGSGSFSLTKNGPGSLQLSGTSSYDGGTTINAGRVSANNISAFGTGPVAVISGSQVFISNANSYSDYTIAGTGYANAADTAAQAGAIRLGNNRTLLGSVTLSAASSVGVETTATGYLFGDLLGSADLEINGPTTTTGSVSLLGSAAGYSGTLSLARGNFNFAGAFGGSMALAPVAGATTTLGAGTAITGKLSLDSTLAAVTFRNPNGTLAITGDLTLTGDTAVSPASFPTPGISTLTLMTYASALGTGTLTFDATNYRGTPTIAVDTTAAYIKNLDGKDLTWDNTSLDSQWNVNSSANWIGGDTLFFHADAVTFGDTAAGVVNLVGTVRPQAITFSNTFGNNYVIAGTGTIDGAGAGILKSGDGMLTLGGANTFTGPVAVNAGRLILGSATGLGYTSGVTVKDGAAFDLNGQKPLFSNRLVDVTIAGTGDGTLPALGNNGADIAFTGVATSGIRNVTLTADATIGVTTVLRNFDIAGIVDGGGHTLTKTGNGRVFLLGPSKNLKVIIAQGSLAAYGNDPFGSTLTIQSGAAAVAGSTATFSSDVTIESGGKLEHSTGTESIWAGTITAPGNVELVNGNTSNTFLTLPKDFAIGGNLTKSGGGSVLLLATADVAGSVAITSGPLQLGSGGTGGSIGATAPITFSGSLPSLIVNRSDNPSLPNFISGPGSFNKQGTGTVTLTANNSYSGTTVISTGTLLINGIQTGIGNVNIVAGTTLGGNGVLPGAATLPVGATLAPGVGIGTFTLGSTGKTTTINGTLRVQYDGSAAPAIDLLRTSDALTLGTASIIDFDSTGTPLTAPAYVIASYAGTLTGTFITVTDLPVGYALVYNYNDGVTSNNIALVKTPYQLWIETFYPGVTNPAIVGQSADPDGDGQSNLMEFALGGTPNNGAANARIYPLTLDSDDAGTAKELLLTVAVRAGTSVFTGTPSPSAAKDGCTYAVQGSLDLAGFVAPVSVVAPVTTGLPAAPAGYEYRTFSLDGSNNLPTKGFLRVQVTP